MSKFYTNDIAGFNVKSVSPVNERILFESDWVGKTFYGYSVDVWKSASRID